jgi:hypothetical protein
LNPWLRKSSLTVADGKTYYISLPKDKIAKTDVWNDVLNDTILLEKTHFDSLR